MQTIYFSTNENILNEWEKKFISENFISVYDIESLESELQKDLESIVIADLDSVSSEINRLISSNRLPNNIIVLEKSPEIPTGIKMINSGVKAYGNSRMLHKHFMQMYTVVLNAKTWTYPELTVALASSIGNKAFSIESIEMIDKRLTAREAEVVYLILEGLTNDAIATKINTSTRTVKAHISSIFSKLHVNDRISLILLLK